MTSQVKSKTSGASYQVSSSSSIPTVDKAEVVLQDVEQAMIDKLIKGLEQLDIISVVGVAGLGKTFLAQRVYRDPRVTSHFHIQAWCCISQTYCKRDLLLQILACIDQKTQFSEKDDYQLALELRQRLLKQKFLIVLDDVWDIKAWNALKSSFPEKNNGSRILLTSRLTDIIGTPYHLRTLDESESYELLQKKLAVIREEGYSEEQNFLGWKIAKTCNGMPLSIAIISGILATLDQAGWEEVAKMVSLTAMVGATEQCSSILELSYGHLPDHLKQCILYFGAFREDSEICVRRLTWLWIAEGFVQKSGSECPEKIAEGYIMALINRSLVMVGQRRCAGEVKTCRIHDLLHVFCVKIAKKQNFLQLVRGYDEDLTFDEPYNPRRLSIQAQPKHFIKSRIICPQIRSLLYSSRDFGVRQLRCNFGFIFLLKLLIVLDLEKILV
nr:putative late blight resistance protein homolog R1B-17 [Coffea arabica]